MGPITQLASSLFPFDYSVTGSGNDAAAAVLNDMLPFKTVEFSSGSELNGWVVPPACSVEKALIRKDGNVVFDARGRPLSVPALSDSFCGRLSLDELKAHLFSVENMAEATPYHWMRLYRPNEPVWGFCMPRAKVDELKPGEYEVELTTRKTPGQMKVFVYELPGDTRETILFDAHNCHPYQANDDISGVVVGIEIMRRLSCLRNRRLSYTLMVAPELFGPMFWLDQLAEDQRFRLVGTVMLKSLGNDRNLRLQESFAGTSSIDLAAHSVFRRRYGAYESGKFRAIYGNDETVFESPPYNIPSISITRWPFPEYHTDQDTPNRLREDRLEDAVQTTVEICGALEKNLRPTTVARGLVCLSRYGLYKPVPPVGANGVDYTSIAGRWNRLMNSFPRLLDGKTDLLQIAENFDLPLDEVHAYARQWIGHGLAK